MKSTALDERCESESRAEQTDRQTDFLRELLFGDRYDWTTGAPHDGNEWKKYRVVPRAHPSRTLLYANFNRFGSKGALSFPGATWDRFRSAVEPLPGHIRCRSLQLEPGCEV